jgi:hypothetical protein
MSTLFAVLCGVAALTVCASALGADAERPLGDLADRVWPIRQGWGYLGTDTAWTGWGQKPVPLRAGGQTYTRGLGTSAPGEILVELDGEYAELRAEIGLQDPGPSGVVFSVVVDGEERYSSGPMRGSEAPRAIRVPVSGAREMVLRAARPAGESGYVSAAWANARLAEGPPRPARRYEEGLDVAPFARAVTCDPKRTTGIRSNRFEEVAAEDVRLEGDLVARRGVYEVAPDAGGLACLGLVWQSRRRLGRLELQFARRGDVPRPETVRLECWKRSAQWPEESAWQGSWTPWPSACQVEGDRMVWPDLRGCPNGAIGTLKVRWVVSSCSAPVRVRSMSAYTRSHWEPAKLVLTAGEGSRRGRATVEVVNGRIEGPGPASGLRCAWDMGAPLPLTVRSWVPDFWRGDRTVLRIVTPRGSFAVAVDDVVARRPVYLKGPGVLLSRTADDESPAAYERRIGGRASMLAEVRSRPDQTREQAFASARPVILHRDDGPTVLSLPCENHKFLVDRFGAILVAAPTTAFPPAYSLSVTPCFVAGDPSSLKRRLEGGWRPIVVNTLAAGAIRWVQRTLVAPNGSDGGPADSPWRGARPLFAAEFAATNPASLPAAADLSLVFAAPRPGAAAPTVRTDASGALVEAGGKLVARVTVPAGGPWRAEALGAELRLTGTLGAGAAASCCLYLPGWEATAEGTASLPDAASLAAATTAYWDAAMSSAARVHVPDELVQNTILASQVHCLMASRSEERGTQVAAWIGATDYPAFDSEAHAIVEGMDLLGHTDYARRCLDYFVARYNPAGYLTHGYTLMGTGWHLWALGRHWELARDAAWMRAAAPKVARVCAWIGAQRKKTMLLTPRGTQVPEYGLLPPGVSADWGAYGYGFCLNGYYYAGLEAAAQALAGIGHPDATAFAADAADLRRAILRAFRTARAQAPALPLRDGAWVPGYPMQVGLPGVIPDFFPDDNMFLTALYDVEIGAHHLAHQGVFDPRSRETGWILDAMEDGPFLRPPPLDPTNRPLEALSRDPFGLGGYAAMQPAYCHNMEIYAMRGEAKPFVRSYLNAMAATLNMENLAFTENTYNPSSPNKTHTTGEFLRRSRIMLALERGDELWLAPCVTANWMKDGMAVALQQAPTAFGPVSYRIESHVREGYIEATVEVPRRRPPRVLVVRLRHPDGLPVTRVRLEGNGQARIDARAELVRVTGATGTLHIRAYYGKTH